MVNGLLHVCLALFPASFRAEFGASMRATVHDALARARARGRLALAWVLVCEVTDLIASAAAERWHPTWAAAPQSRADWKDRLMRAVEQWLRDLRLAGRSVSRAPSFALAATGTLALALAASGAIFAVVDAVLLDSPPFAHRDRLTFVVAEAPGSEISGEFGVFDEAFLHVRGRSALIEDFAFFGSFTGTVRIGDRVERLRMGDVTYNLFATLGVTPLIGRLPRVDAAASDPDRSGRIAVLSHALWRDWLGSDPNVIGRSYVIDGGMREIVAVMRPDFVLANDAVVAWIPRDVRLDGLTLAVPGFAAVARLAPGVTADAAARELTSMMRELPERFGRNPTYDRVLPRLQVHVRPLEAELVGPVRRPLFVLFGAALIVLLIACANVGHLVAMRAEGRRHELAIRQAVGAGRGQLVRSQFAEILVIAALAGVVATVLARVALPAFLALAPVNVPNLGTASVGLRATAFIGALAACAAAFCGLLPALRASRVGMTDMRRASRSVAGGRRWARDLLLVAQTAMALVLTVGAGLLLRSYAQMSRVDPGYRTDDIYTFQIAPSQPQLTDGPSYARFSLDLMDRLAALRDVQSVGLIENLPLDEGTAATMFLVEGATADAGVRLFYTFAGPGYFDTMGIDVLAGQAFDRDDAIGMRGRAVVSRAAARMLFPDGDAVGRRIRGERSETWETVAGVVEDVIQENWRQALRPTVYLPMTGHTPGQWRLPSPAYVVKTTRAETIGPEIRALVREVAPEAPMYRDYTMAFLAGRQMRDLSFTTLTLGFVSVLALVLGAVGLYGSLAYAVTQRTREIGVRLALGAQPSTVQRMVVRQGIQVVAVGIAVGLAMAWLAAPALGRLLFGVAPLDLTTFLVVPVSMVVVGLLASFVPARRASLVDPLVSLRGE